MKRATSGKCRCIKNYSNKNLRDKYPKFPVREYKIGDIYQFEYKSDEDNCWLYYLYKDGERTLCNWSFFDDVFEVIE